MVFLSERKCMSYYYVNVEILIESDSEDNARDSIESYIDNLVSNKKNNDLQDYTILTSELLETLD
jgi:hypothetical protein